MVVSTASCKTESGDRLFPVGLGVGAYLWWGTVGPVYFWLLQGVDTLELALLRIILSIPFIYIVSRYIRREQPNAGKPKYICGRWSLVAGAGLLGANWLTFVYAMHYDRVLDASLGYYLNPLTTVLLGFVILGERLRPAQAVAATLGLVAVIMIVIGRGELPWVSVVLAVSMSLYALLHKRSASPTIPTIRSELSLLAIPALVMVLLHYGAGGVSGDRTVIIWVLISLSGVHACVPLVLFSAAARRLPMTTLSFLQYIAPTGQFVLAIILFGEVVPLYRMVAFGIIWISLIIFSVDVVYDRKSNQ